MPFGRPHGELRHLCIFKRCHHHFLFESSLQVHVNLLLMEARMQAELLYALRAITRHLT